jgi:hypothetical protein
MRAAVVDLAVKAEVVDRAEQIKWRNALDEFTRTTFDVINVEAGLQMARECRHPDAQWLAALFPAAVAVTQQRMVEVMLEQGEDPRAMWLAGRLSLRENLRGLVVRSAQMGYAPAQAT